MRHAPELLAAAAAVLVAVALGTLRARGHKSQVFQALAHLYVGGLFAAAAAVALCRGPRAWAWFLLALAVALSLLEVVCFLVLPRPREDPHEPGHPRR